jgi:hypothetical protein
MKETTVPPASIKDIKAPASKSEMVEGHLCNRCVNMKLIGDGGQDEASGTWEFYWQGCGLSIGEYGLPFCVDPLWGGPDENGNITIVVDCQWYGMVQERRRDEGVSIARTRRTLANWRLFAS